MRRDQKLIGVFASGGHDSLYLMAKNLEFGHAILPIHVTTNVNADQKTAESIAVESQVEALKRKYPDQVEMLFIKQMNDWEGMDCGIDMPPMFVLAALWSDHILKTRHGKELDEIQLAYILGDHAISYLDDMHALWNALGQFWSTSEYSINPSRKISKLSFPMTRVIKDEVIYHLRERYPDIADHAWTCESPGHLISGIPSDWPFGDLVPCGECPSCRSLKKISIADPIPAWVREHWGRQREFKSSAKLTLSKIRKSKRRG